MTTKLSKVKNNGSNFSSVFYEFFKSFYTSEGCLCNKNIMV